MQTRRTLIDQVWRSPLLWILMLMPIAAVGHWLALFWPSADGMMNLSSEFSADHRMLVVHQRYANPRKSATGQDEPDTNRHFQIDLETGGVMSISDLLATQLLRDFTYQISLDESRSESTDGGIGNGLRRWKVSHRESDGSESIYQVFLPGTPQILGDSYIVTSSDEKLFALKLGEPNAVPMEYEVCSKDGKVLQSSNERLIFYDGQASEPSRQLFELNDSGFRKMGGWPAREYGGLYRMNDQEVVLLANPDASQEIRTLITNELVPIQIDPSIDLSTSRWGLGRRTNSLWVVSGTQNVNFEFGTWRRIPNSGLDTFWLHERSRGRSILANVDIQSVVCVDDATGERIWERNDLFPECKTGLSLHALGEDRILVHSLVGFDALILDRATGATIAKHRPLWAMPYILIGWVVVILLWWIGWFARSVADGGWAWLDCAGFLVFCLLAITGRILVSGETTSESRFEMRIAQGISAAGLALTCLWIVFGKTRWTLKILPPMVWLAFVCAIVMTAFGLRSWAVGASILTLSMVFLWLLLAAWIMRVKGIRLVNLSRVESTVQPVAGNASRFPLRDIFYLTAVVAVLSSVVRYSPLPEWTMFDRGFVEGLMNCLLMSINAMVVSWCALSPRAIWVRWSVWLASPLLCAMLGVLFGAWLYKSNNYQGMAEYHGVVQLTGAIAIFFSLHAYRWRDWRFEV